MKNGGSFRDLKVWRDAMMLVEEIYRLTRRFPAEERFGLTSQIRRAAVSIPSNIGEGKRRKRQRALLNHLDIALGSQGEVTCSSSLRTGSDSCPGRTSSQSRSALPKSGDR